MAESGKQHLVTAVTEEKGTTCWGCGLGLLLPTLGSAFKCGWCGAITNHNLSKNQNQCLLWRRLRDRCFVSFLFSFMLFVICGGVWAAFPIIFLVSYTSGIVHSVITTILALTTISTFGLSAFQCAGAPPMILWGSYTVVGKGELENYTFCHYCSKPKSPRAHHCDTAVPVECVYWIWIITILLELCRRSESSALHSFSNFSYIQHNLRNSDVCIYEFPYMAAIEVQTAGTLDHFQHGSGDVGKQGRSCGIVKLSNGTAGKRVGFNLSFHCQHIGGDKLSVLLWQQLCYIYEGRTYLSHLSSREGDHVKEKDCQNLLRFFGCRYSMLRFLPTLRNSRKRHKT
ncbi:hypothetical protein PVK06_017124 [Gossypium arboreum]|uniref:Palmitoyltransferase n=1 Tax=Gossypium arboreum TaxID=29729 RepID=A0ABR0Q2N3_GOSAR|nr:hypothetical protein PVK06_017124 [Gossypium arboreum]